MAIPANLIRIQRIPVGAAFDTEREFTWRFRRLLAFVAPDLVRELERAVLRFPLRGATHKLSKDNMRFKRAVKEAQHETDKERLWSSEEVHCRHARSNIIYRWFEMEIKVYAPSMYSKRGHQLTNLNSVTSNIFSTRTHGSRI